LRLTLREVYTARWMLDAIAPSPTREELVYDRLRQAIVAGTLRPGQELVVTTIAAQLGVSRIPVMHACQRLIGEGFLVANPRRSATVAALTEARIEEGNEVLLALECLALEHTARRATADDLTYWATLNAAVRAMRPEDREAWRGPLAMLPDHRFHTAIWKAAGKPYLERQIALVYDHNEPARSLGRARHDAARSADEHDELLEALRRKDVPAAQVALRRHRCRGTAIQLEVLRAGARAADGR
jgi:DNA-binding GntR family transcriptional regulator